MVNLAAPRMMLLALGGSVLQHLIHTPVQALLLLLFGVLAVCLECAWPGRYVAGAAGAALCLLGVAALSAFPLSAYGAGLVLLAAISFGWHARHRGRWLPLACGAALLTLGVHFLIGPPAPRVAAGVALALTLPASLVMGLLLDIARRSRAAKRQPINTGLDAAHNCPHNRETLELRPRENRSAYDD